MVISFSKNPPNCVKVSGTKWSQYNQWNQHSWVWSSLGYALPRKVELGNPWCPFQPGILWFMEGAWIIRELPLFPESCLESGTAHAQCIKAIDLKYMCFLIILLCLHWPWSFSCRHDFILFFKYTGSSFPACFVEINREDIWNIVSGSAGVDVLTVLDFGQEQ